MTEEPLGASAARSEFENYVPGLLVFAVVMLVFLAAMTVTREVEAGTLRRLQITRMTSLDFLGGISASLALIGVAQVVLTFLTALALGFHSQGPLWVAILVGIVTSFSVIGAGLVVACFSKTVTQAFLAASFPMVLFMFFSGAIYPVPRVSLFVLAGRTFGLYDVLPPTHAVVALNKVLTLGAGPGDVIYELTALFTLSMLYFAAGVWLFRRTHLKAA
jgi:ABC-2 type transport system permease protein